MPRRAAPLTTERILSAALKIADRNGLDGLSLRTLATALHITPMALYRHFPDKEALLDALHEAVLREGPIPEPQQSWRDDLVVMARTTRDAIKRHPGTALLFATRSLRHPALLVHVDRWCGRLLAAGFGSSDAVYIIDAIGIFAVGHALSELGGPRSAKGSKSAKAADAATLKRLGLFHLARLSTDHHRHDFDASFELGLAALLDGLEARLARQENKMT
ncbi:MAG: TetR/AcrR family transcriptional regulator [Deltaproteobacteria bacterium]|nr:TetR/AcrR family transcriptional regulator [Deltaproteobacteria bacterium]